MPARGSTISVQTAKNVFLWPGRDWLRKGFETWFTTLMTVQAATAPRGNAVLDRLPREPTPPDSP
jgi:hypothetical protein